MIRIPIPKFVLTFIAKRRQAVERINKLCQQQEHTSGPSLAEDRATFTARSIEDFDKLLEERSQRAQPTDRWIRPRLFNSKWGRK